jgi:hypothetical protein
MKRLALVLFAFAVGCSDNLLTASDAGVDAGEALDISLPPDLQLSDRDPTDHPQLPQVDNQHGPVLDGVQLWTVVWPGDEVLGARANTFTEWMLGSDYWVNSLNEYGVGRGKALGVLVLPNAAPASIDDSAFSNIIKDLIARGVVQYTPTTALAFIVPKGTTSTLQGGQGCQDYGGYHSETRTVKGGSDFIPYSVTLQCPVAPGVSDFDGVTQVLSHEGAEMATDPHPFTRPGWSNKNIPDGSEIADLCVDLNVTIHGSVSDPDAGVTEADYSVTRLYSQKAAAAGKSDPCVPVPTDVPYFNVGIEPPQLTIQTDTTGAGTFTAKIEPYAFGDVGMIRWRLESQPGPGVTVAPTHGTARAGQTVLMTVTVTAQAQRGDYTLMLTSHSDKGGDNEWFSSLTIQ